MGQLSDIFGPYRLIWLSLWVHYAALKDSLRKDGVASLAHPRKIRDAAQAKMLILASPHFIAHENTTTVPTLVASARGRILELGPGAGNQIHRFTPSNVKFIWGVDPNPGFRSAIASKVRECGLEDKYRLLTCGIEDSDVLRAEGVVEGGLDTVVSIQVLCAVHDVRGVMREVYRLLRPGGAFVFWEHGRNEDGFTAGVQACWNPAWSALVGCNMNRDIKKEILAAGEWENPGDVEEVNERYSCLPRSWGVLIKKA